MVYVGQNGQTLDRLKEHKRALTSGNLAQSAIAEHAAQESNAIDWKEADSETTMFVLHHYMHTYNPYTNCSSF